MTFDSAQSRSLLADEADVRFVPEVAPRAFGALLRNVLPALRLLFELRPRAVYSTGAGIALAFLPFAFLVRARAIYFESATRTHGPSVTGRLLALAPWIHLRTRYRSWSSRRWLYAGSAFDAWEPVQRDSAPTPVRQVVVSLGTQPAYPFVSLVRRLQEITPDGVEIRWQLGGGFAESDRPSGARDFVPAAELREWMRSADVVVAHAGVGSALTVLDSGHVPVLVPRNADDGEHIDDHQTLLARELAARGLAITSPSHELSWDDIVRATRVMPRDRVPRGLAAGSTAA
ncbi:glycosyltransferase [Jatrophihabitans sp.]|uniref:glycosyltransferase n=1 Tax=Jatrophihabitans sp. TaxID=1932789 RepID=UPI002E18F857